MYNCLLITPSAIPPKQTHGISALQFSEAMKNPDYSDPIRSSTTFDHTVVIETPGETIEFPEQDIRSVWVGGRQISELHALVESSNQKAMKELEKKIENDRQVRKAIKTIVLCLGVSTLIGVAVAIGLVSYMVSEIHTLRDMVIDWFHYYESVEGTIPRTKTK